MKRFIALLVMLLPAPALAQPSIAFMEESHSFGEVTQGAVIEHVFEFTNQGTEDLVILDLKSA